VNQSTLLSTLRDTTWKVNSTDRNRLVARWSSGVGNRLSRHKCGRGERITQSAKHSAGRQDAKIATFDTKIESMRFAPGSAAKGAGKGGRTHVYERAVTAASFHVRENSGPLVERSWSGTSMGSAPGSVVDHSDSVGNHAGSPQAFA
jgi:hypothetical protein